MRVEARCCASRPGLYVARLEQEGSARASPYAQSRMPRLRGKVITAIA